MKLSDAYLLGAIVLGVGALLFGATRTSESRDPTAKSAPIKEDSQPREYPAPPSRTSSPSLFESGSLGVPDDSPP